MTNLKYVIYAPSYNERVGGIIVLHRLCHLLNEISRPAFIVPYSGGRLAPIKRAFFHVSDRLPLVKTVTNRRYNKNSDFKTPLLPWGVDLSPAHTITVYPETVYGNPLQARNIVRWFLHKPGFHTGRTGFGRNEFHIDFNQFLHEYTPKENYLSPSSLYVVYFPLDIYHRMDTLPAAERNGTAYCVRKGQKDRRVNLTNAICIDEMSHQEAAEVLRSVKYFYSFDPYTAYSTFAALCGAISLVLPPPNLTKECWYPSEENRYGIGFGLDDEEWAIDTQELVLPTLQRREKDCIEQVKRFATEAELYFSKCR